jgi:hypothetical protein
MALRLLARAWESWGNLALANQRRPDKTVGILGCIGLYSVILPERGRLPDANPPCVEASTQQVAPEFGVRIPL